jgi:tryptophanyl-tRNA synthetase
VSSTISSSVASSHARCTPQSESIVAGLRAADVVLTGDRPTGVLHLGHYAGSLGSRVALQGRCSQTLLIADLQALTDSSGRASHVAAHVDEVALDYLAAGIDPSLTTIAVQSRLPALAGLTVLYLNLVTVARLERNPTVKAEIEARGFDRDIPAGFLCYPVSQAADITAFRATLVPVGEDQLPMIEQTNEIVRRVNRMADASILPQCRALLSSTPRLPGIDGRKASKSLGNSISIGASASEISRLVHAMYTDAGHVRASDPGRVDGNVVFAYLRAFDPDTDGVAELERQYAHGGLGDITVKRRLEGVLQQIVAPMRERRALFARELSFVRAVVREGTERADGITHDTLQRVRAAFALA